MSKLSLPVLQRKLEKLFEYTESVANNPDLVWDTRVAAAQASAQIADVLLGIRDFGLMSGMILDPDDFDEDEEDYDHSPLGRFDSGPDQPHPDQDPGPDDGLDLEDS